MKRLSFLCALVVLPCPSVLAADAVLEMEAKDWKYLDTSEAPGKDWATPDFDDSDWEKGQAPLGYGDDHIKKEVAFGDDKENKRLCVFFRRNVEIDDPMAAKKIHIQLTCDDGCAVFVNGKEVIRHNLPDGEITDKTEAPLTCSGDMETHKFNFLVDPAKFKAGKNAIAARVHQRGSESSDLAFDISIKPLTDDDDVTAAERQNKMEQDLFARALEELPNGG